MVHAINQILHCRCDYDICILTLIVPLLCASAIAIDSLVPVHATTTRRQASLFSYSLTLQKSILFARPSSSSEQTRVIARIVGKSEIDSQKWSMHDEILAVKEDGESFGLKARKADIT